MKLQQKTPWKDVKPIDFSLKCVILGGKIVKFTIFKLLLTQYELVYKKNVVLLPVKRFLMVKVYGWLI